MKRQLPGMAALLVVGLCCLCAGCSGPADQEAVKNIESAGGKVKIDKDGRVIEVDLSRTPGNDALIAELAALPDLQSINCSEMRIKGTGLTALSGLRNVHTLFLVGTPLKDNAMPAIAKLTSLRTLHLGRTEITDAGLPALRHLTNLRTLSLGHTAITDAGLVNLRGLHDLSTLIVHHTNVTEAGVRDLRRSLPDTRIEN
ncbi:MAG: hypothetical protein AB7O59_01250 [Pirellulales bacterium]